MTIPLPEIPDPHCGRSSDDFIHFDVLGERWAARWGRYDAFGTPSYWVNQTVRRRTRGHSPSRPSDLLSEIIFCLLGGYGVTAEAAASAHREVMRVVAETEQPSQNTLEEVLRSPLPPRGHRYRFPAQRSARIASAITAYRTAPPPTDARPLHQWLLALPGVGPKTAAWIVRNHTGSDEVVIVDIWLIRALSRCGVFQTNWNVSKHYERYEQAFLSFADQGDVRASALDLCIWEQARTAGSQMFTAA